MIDIRVNELEDKIKALEGKVNRLENDLRKTTWKEIAYKVSSWGKYSQIFLTPISTIREDKSIVAVCVIRFPYVEDPEVVYVPLPPKLKEDPLEKEVQIFLCSMMTAIQVLSVRPVKTGYIYIQYDRYKEIKDNKRIIEWEKEILLPLKEQYNLLSDIQIDRTLYEYDMHIAFEKIDQDNL